MSKSRILNIKAENVVLENIIFTRGSADSGGAIYNIGDNLKIVNCSFTSNSIRLYGGGIFSNGDNVSISNCRFTSNYAQYTGGAIELDGDNNFVGDSFFENNDAGHVGGDVAWVGANGNLTNCKFTHPLENKRYNYVGGSVVWMGANGSLTKSSFYKYYAKNYGAAVYWAGNNGSLNYCIFVNNTSGDDSVYCGNPNYANYNYWGVNVASTDEFVNDKLISYEGTYYSPEKWVNIEVSKKSVDFKLNDKRSLNESLPDYEIKVSNSKIVIHDNSYKFPLATSLTGSNVITYSMYNGKYLSVTLKDEDNKKLDSKKIQIKLNNKPYTVYTNKNGVAKLKIYLKTPKTYKASVSFKGDKNYKSCSKTVQITVKKQKPTITLKTKSLKAKSKKKIIKVVLKDQFKKAISKKTLKITINKKTYSAKTNSKGIASFKVSLKTKKTYKYTVKFKGNSYYKAISKNGSVKVK